MIETGEIEKWMLPMLNVAILSVSLEKPNGLRFTCAAERRQVQALVSLPVL
jgi:hypothetical protein